VRTIHTQRLMSRWDSHSDSYNECWEVRLNKMTLHFSAHEKKKQTASGCSEKQQRKKLKHWKIIRILNSISRSKVTFVFKVDRNFTWVIVLWVSAVLIVCAELSSCSLQGSDVLSWVLVSSWTHCAFSAVLAARPGTQNPCHKGNFTTAETTLHHWDMRKVTFKSNSLQYCVTP